MHCFLYFLIFFYINRVLLDTVIIGEKCWSRIFYNFWKNFSKAGIADAYRVDEIDVDSHFFYSFSDVFTQNNKIIRFSKRFDYATFSLKKFEYDYYVTKQNFNLST